MIIVLMLHTYYKSPSCTDIYMPSIHPSINCIHFMSEVVQAKFTYQVSLTPVSCCRTSCGCVGPGGGKSGCNGGTVPAGVGYVFGICG